MKIALIFKICIIRFFFYEHYSMVFYVGLACLCLGCSSVILVGDLWFPWSLLYFFSLLCFTMSVTGGATAIWQGGKSRPC